MPVTRVAIDMSIATKLWTAQTQAAVEQVLDDVDEVALVDKVEDQAGAAAGANTPSR